MDFWTVIGSIPEPVLILLLIIFVILFSYPFSYRPFDFTCPFHC